MDSSDLQSTNSTETASSNVVDNSSMITPYKRDIFLSTYNPRQKFTLPDPIMYYIAKNPKNSEVYQKMVKCCKYFFIKNSILVVPHLFYEHNGWETLFKGVWKNININKLLCKLWLTDVLCVDSVVSSIIPKIYQCDLECLNLQDQIISLNEFIFLCSSVEELFLVSVTVKNDDGTVVSFEKIVEQLPQLKEIYYIFTTPSNNTTKNTFKELWKNPHLSNYDYFELSNIPEEFDIDSFYSIMKKNKNTSMSLNFSDQISEESETRLEAIIDEIIGTKNHEYKPPLINFPGLDEEKFNELNDIFSS